MRKRIRYVTIAINPFPCVSKEPRVFKSSKHSFDNVVFTNIIILEIYVSFFIVWCNYIVNSRYEKINKDGTDVKTIIRKTMLYQTGVEYGDYTMNHVQGCAHGCKYPCYAFLMKKRFGQIKDYNAWLEPYLVSNTLELLDKEIPRLKNRIKSVQLCFSTDPFMFGYPEITEMSLAAIRKLNAAGIKCTTLTKGILPIELEKLSPENEHGITLISLDETYREQMEPGAVPYVARLAALRALHEDGCKTWVSIEPYPTPNLITQNLHELLETVSFTDRIIFGKMNYNKEVTAFAQHKAFYNACAAEVINFCEQQGIQYHIKEKTIRL